MSFIVNYFVNESQTVEVNASEKQKHLLELNVTNFEVKYLAFVLLLMLLAEAYQHDWVSTEKWHCYVTEKHCAIFSVSVFSAIYLKASKIKNLNLLSHGKENNTCGHFWRLCLVNDSSLLGLK